MASVSKRRNENGSGSNDTKLILVAEEDAEPIPPNSQQKQPVEPDLHVTFATTQSNSQQTNLSRIAGALLYLVLFWVLISSSGRRPSDIGSTSETVKLKKSSFTSKSGNSGIGINFPDFSTALAKYEDCVISFVPPPPKSHWTTKPFFLTSYPGSGSSGPTGKGDLLKPLIQEVTGLKGGAKFYHASSKKLKRCKGQDETATCSQGHPVIDIQPEKRVNDFQSSVFLLVRDYRMTFPTHMNDKAEAYHGAKELMPEEAWRKSRDQWYKVVFDGWKEHIMTWKNMKEYDIGIYIEYEALMDPDRGPITLKHIAAILQAAGFTVAPETDMPCIWFNAVKDEYIRLKEYWKYIPGYTSEQQDYLLQELDKFQQEVSDDNDLVAILKEYYDDTRDNTRIDKAASS
jgi:hypothetical protein